MAYQFEAITVLVVEDNPAMLEITKSLLLTFGVGQVIGARDGDEGFEKFKRYNPDLVIADWMMKPIDGISFTRRVRNDPGSPNPYTPIILMTGFSEKRRVFQARDSGVTEFLVKPFTARDLYKRIAQVVERPRQFVRSTDFFGPDRRRKGSRDFQGPFKRHQDKNFSQNETTRTTIVTERDIKGRKERTQNANRQIEKVKQEQIRPEEINADDIDFI